MASIETAERGEIWLVALGGGRSGEPGKTRPAVVVSVNELNSGSGPDELMIVVPLSSSLAPSSIRIEVGASARIARPSLAICRAIRAVVRSRLLRRVGSVEPTVMEEIEAALGLILGLDRRAV